MSAVILVIACAVGDGFGRALVVKGASDTGSSNTTATPGEMAGGGDGSSTGGSSTIVGGTGNGNSIEPPTPRKATRAR